MVLESYKNEIKEAVNNNDEEAIETIAKRLRDWIKIDDLLINYGYGNPWENILKRAKRIPDKSGNKFNPK